MSIDSLVPVSGPSSGSSEVLVYGSFFPARANLQCKFGLQAPTLARWIAEDKIACRTPAHPPTAAPVRGGGTCHGFLTHKPASSLFLLPTRLLFLVFHSITQVDLTVFASEIDMAIRTSAFWFLDRANVTHVHPAMHFPSASMLTYVSGLRLTEASTLLCDFAGETTAAAFVNATLVACPTPSMMVRPSLYF